MEWLGPTLRSPALLPRESGAAAPRPPAAKPPSTGDGPGGDSDFHVSFDDLIDIVNPLQHLPVVGTLYRAITHDHIKTPEKIAGDALYGGLWGFVSSLADTVFEKITGHDVGDTVLAFLTGRHDAAPRAVAGAGPAAAAAAADGGTVMPEAPATADVSALSQSLRRAGVDGDLAQRALYAYRRSNETLAQAAVSPF
ncbi:MAG TPA: hypothetical protein VG819_09155 [Rhizomicrobium sp.]|jgi:hypothetical protein|nr:hypothetical protein [Rhizomicrobium sp.]